MEITPFTLYLITRLDGLLHASHGLTFLSGVTIVAGIFIYFIEFYGDKEVDAELSPSREKGYRLVCGMSGWFMRTVFVIFLLLGWLVPSSKELAAFIIIPKVVNSDLVQEDIPGEIKELYGLTKDWLISEVNKEKE